MGMGVLVVFESLNVSLKYLKRYQATAFQKCGRLMRTFLHFAEIRSAGQLLVAACLLGFLRWTDPLIAQGGDSFTPPVTMIEGSERLEEWDVVWLSGGESVRGKVLNATLDIHTSYGSYTLQKDWLAGLRIDAGPGHADRVKTANRNLFVGFINDSIQFESESGENQEWTKDRIDHIVFHRRAEESLHEASGSYVLLENGDLISGELQKWLPFIPLPNQRASIRVEDIELVQFAHESRTLRILLQDGKEISTGWPQEAIRIRLDLGPECVLPISHVQTLYMNTKTLPWVVRKAFDEVDSISGDDLAHPPAPSPKGMVWVPPGHFQMGSSLIEKGRDPDEDPLTEVRITQGFWMGEHEVTQGEYQEIMGSNPSGYRGSLDLPVEKVTWNEAVAYGEKLSAREREAGRLPPGFIYRLPTESEWEYACRGESMTRFHYGDDPSETELTTYAWFIENSQSTTHPVAQLKPNARGLYDMHGNVWEWCQDIWQDAYPGGEVRDHVGEGKGWLRVARGGSWLYSAAHCRSANRDSYGPNNRCSDIGFRVVLGAE